MPRLAIEIVVGKSVIKPITVTNSSGKQAACLLSSKYGMLAALRNIV
jgi:hypothetical protein